MERDIIEEAVKAVAQMQKELERSFSNLWARLAGREGVLRFEVWEPPADVVDKGEEIVIYVDLPGFAKDEVTIRVMEDSVEVQARKSAEQVVEGEYVLRQRVRRELFKRIALPVKVRPESAKARLESGVLELKVPKGVTTREVQVTVE